MNTVLSELYLLAQEREKQVEQMSTETDFARGAKYGRSEENLIWIDRLAAMIAEQKQAGRPLKLKTMPLRPALPKANRNTPKE
jgi:hypothetical protein